MNYLKKIKHAVHKKRKDDNDDDDFDNYVPEVPPHPGDLGDPNFASANFANFNTTALTSSLSSAADSAAKTLANLATSIRTSLDRPEAEVNKENLSLEELKAREEEHKRAEKEKLRQAEEEKKDCAEWQYFLNLTSKVDAITSKTQTVLTKLKDESAVKDISKVEDPCFSDKYLADAPKTAGTWIAFEDQEANPSDPVWIQQEEEKSPEEITNPVVDENTQRLARELIDDFGFTNPAPGIPVPEDVWKEKEESTRVVDDSVDPFDTSFIDVEAIRSGAPIKPKNTLFDIDFDKPEDPFDTSHIESLISKDLVIGDQTTEE